MLIKIKQQNENRIKIKKKYALKRERAERFSTHKKTSTRKKLLMGAQPQG